MAARWGVTSNAREKGLGCFQGIAVAILPGIAFWLIIGLVIWAIIA